MTIWILAVLLLASLIGLGLRQGAIRVAASLIGILLGAMLAAPLGNLLKPVFSAIGVKNPALLWLVPPLFVFVIILTLAKVGGLMLHKKVEVHFKYKAGDLRLALWERLNQRLGMCLGTLNAIAYLVLIAQAIYMISYWTYQVSTEADPVSVRIVNRLGKDLQSTGLSKTAAAVDDTSPAYYDAADIAGLLYQTPELSERLSRYPGVLGLAERPEFQDLANDAEFNGLRKQGASISEVLNHPKTQSIMNNADLLNAIESSLVPNLKDLRAFLETGVSETFSEPLLGRWNLDVTGTVGLLRREKSQINQREAAGWRNWLAVSAANCVLIATPEKQIFLKNAPLIRMAAGTVPVPQVQSVQGEWESANGKYRVTLPVDGRSDQFTVELQGNRLTVTGGDYMGITFYREE